MKKTILPIFLSSVWISFSEFVRNTFLLHTYWVNHYHALGMTFPEANINGAIWGVWSLCFAIVIFILKKKFSLIETALLSWFIGFVMMWLVIGNLGVLPLKILGMAVPLSIIETFIATIIISKFDTPSKV